jgi:hypothetical protein
MGQEKHAELGPGQAQPLYTFISAVLDQIRRKDSINPYVVGYCTYKEHRHA